VTKGEAGSEDSYPSTGIGDPAPPGDTAWTVLIINAKDTDPASGNVYVTCVG
jgi:hypothetical protein